MVLYHERASKFTHVCTAFTMGSSNELCVNTRAHERSTHREPMGVGVVKSMTVPATGATSPEGIYCAGQAPCPEATPIPQPDNEMRSCMGMASVPGWGRVSSVWWANMTTHQNTVNREVPRRSQGQHLSRATCSHAHSDQTTWQPNKGAHSAGLTWSLMSLFTPPHRFQSG